MRYKYLLLLSLCSCASAQSIKYHADELYNKWYDDAAQCLISHGHKVTLNADRMHIYSVPNGSLGIHAAAWGKINEDSTFIKVERQFIFDESVMKHEFIHELTNTSNNVHGKPFTDCGGGRIE